MTATNQPDMTGIEVRHARRCKARRGGSCDCSPSYRAAVWSQRDKRKIQRTFSTPRAARTWREDAKTDLRRGVLRVPRPTTVREVGDKWIRDAKAGTVRNRSGDQYKPSVLRGYEQALRDRIYPDLGGAKLSEITRQDVQTVVDSLDETGLSASTVRNALLPLRAICRRALARGQITANPTTGLELRAVRSSRDRVADPIEAAALIAALDLDRALWATAMYAGLRRGELRALRWSDVDLASGVIHVRRGWDAVEGELEPKSRAGVRKVPIATALRRHLVEVHEDTTALAFGIDPERPFEPWSVADRATKAWKQAELTRITLHECRHTFASLMIAAGVNAKALQVFMGHASVSITLDRYGHLFPGSEQQAGVLLDQYLERTQIKSHVPTDPDRGETAGKS
ncbi:site-specific integrase [Solirubrobacter ginsenosidimutans]|uniref:Site-specific integrase n=1 Tax=Solirubrobacter ginsenosidimutans TaxID=490573 RepID=A0A9X3MWW5_9ACTN|nr:site-specific integrase [Solirubrobacter ginsenosidimutans]MDA0163151.1 site-specific integrase [Solirubrobacter ginsenosidimutans]